MRRFFIPKTIFFLAVMFGSVDTNGMAAVTSLGASLLKSEFVKNHARDFGVMLGGLVVVGVYKSFFSRLDRIEALVQEIEEKISNTYESLNQLDGTVKIEIQNILEKITQLPSNKDMEAMLLELRKILIGDMRQLNNQTSQRILDFEVRVSEQLARLEKSLEEKIARLEQKIDRYHDAVKAYQGDVKTYQVGVDTGLGKIVQGQKEILEVLPPTQGLKSVVQQKR